MSNVLGENCVHFMMQREIENREVNHFKQIFLGLAFLVATGFVFLTEQWPY